MKKKKYLPLVGAIILCGIIFPFLLGGNDGRYVVSYDEIKPIKSYRPSKIKLYIENSGSMDGYMFDGSELKDAVYSYVSGLSTHSDTTELYFVNTNIYNVNISLNDFPQDPIRVMSEGQRMIYVACSRAKQFLALAVPSSISDTEINRSFSGVGVVIKNVNLQAKLEF